MNRNFMVKKVDTDAELIMVVGVLQRYRIKSYTQREDGSTLIKVNVGGTKKRTTKRFDICKELGFEERGAFN